MRVLVTGVEQSGTGFVTSVLREAGAEVLHRAMPHVHDWHAPLAARHNVDRVVVVVRGLLGHERSMTARSGNLRRSGWTAGAHRRRGLAILACLLQDPRTVLVTYESLARPAEVGRLCDELGLDGSAVVSRWRDTGRCA